MAFRRKIPGGSRRIQEPVRDRERDLCQDIQVLALQQQAVGKPLARDRLLDDGDRGGSRKAGRPRNGGGHASDCGYLRRSVTATRIVFSIQS
ncbi:MAG: hypothetical protein RLZZ221_1609 [Verrucomicrobiota bacterium]